MSERNGDKAKFGRERRHKILMRERAREVRAALIKKTAEKVRDEAKSGGSL